jgi:membrane fusion protein (multidrug efflux system)
VEKKLMNLRDKISHTTPMVKMLIGVGILFGLIFAYKIFGMIMFKIYMSKAKNGPTVTVSTMQAKYQLWNPQVKASASLRATRGVDVTTEIAGLVKSINFTPGAEVTEGTLLVQLNVDADIAQLHVFEAQAELAKTVYARDKAQYAIQAVSKAQLDTDEADLKSKNAQVEEQKAIIEKKTIRAPFSGRLGISAVNLGQYVNPGDKVVTLQTLDPIWVDFFVPQQEMPQLQVGQTIGMRNDSFPGEIFTGKITTINPKVEVDTRNVEVEATIANPHGKLIPGMFANVRIETGEPQPFITLPQTAITYNPYGEVVFVVKPQEKEKDSKGKPILIVNQVFVKVGETRGDQVAVLKGLKEGETVVTSGQLKLKNGTRVKINNTILPSDDPHPNPVDE